MNTAETSSVDMTDEQSISEQVTPITRPQISGFDGAARPIGREPALYVSIAVVTVVAAINFGKTAQSFALGFACLSLLAIGFYILAERIHFRTKREFSEFSAPFEGVFVLALGAILPGLALLGYGGYSVYSSLHENLMGELAKALLLSVVPLFNFAVWKSLRKGYLLRPRLTGLLNGLALGLSASWTAIWLKCLFIENSVPCKFGWMLLLCTSPFLLFAALCLFRDLRQKTEPEMKRITVSFASLGCLLSLLFVFAPLFGAMSLQSLVDKCRQGSPEQREIAMSTLRTVMAPSELRTSADRISGFTLSELLIPSYRLDGNSDADKELYFQITGQSCAAMVKQQNNDLIGGTVEGLSANKSQITGNIDATTLTGALDWNMTFRNKSASQQEARCELQLPTGAVVSRVTLWINGKPQEAAFATTAVAQSAFEAVVRQKRDPLLVTLSGADTVLIRCFPVPANGATRIRIGLKTPLETVDGQTASLTLPRLVGSNFTVPQRQRLTINSSDTLRTEIPGIVQSKVGTKILLTAILHHGDEKAIHSICIQRSHAQREFATKDWFSRGKQYIVTALQKKVASRPTQLFVVLDSSSSLEKHLPALRDELLKVPSEYRPRICLVPAPTEQIQLNGSAPIQTFVTPSNFASMEKSFVGGKDNQPALKSVIEAAAEIPDSAVLWIHGPQPFGSRPQTQDDVDLLHPVTLYDLQVAPGPSTTIQELEQLDPTGSMKCESIAHTSIAKDFEKFIDGWRHPSEGLGVERTVTTRRPNMTVIDDQDTSAASTCLWANEYIDRLIAAGDVPKAEAIGTRYRLITPVTAGVVLESDKDYAAFKLHPGAWIAGQYGSINETYRGMHQFFNDDVIGNLAGQVGQLVARQVAPRYGQSNEVGQLADYGYDKARDAARILVLLSLLISIMLAIAFVRSQPVLSVSVVAKAASLTIFVPLIVHLTSLFMINNFGGLGGGL